ncbi:uncharacterized protein LOC122390904 [Amphibalanus amphitrite]|uniref:uncharacterized protein LOC122390904 n=1 Tax=Amphibalanus amphitrite TaxID=1232801 RepID=UPI001C9120E6|nr:uncharacterized protein LOC122390904 [Amphibalanus amphitrite]
MIVTIKPVNKHTLKKDKTVATHPGLIRIVGCHNHTTTGEAALKELRVLPSVARSFNEYFEQGMGASEAARHHSRKRAAEGDALEVARKDTNPTRRAVDYMLQLWKKNKHRGQNDADVIHSLKRYAAAHPELSIDMLQTVEHFCVSLVTPFMRRAHKEIREAGEVVYVDGAVSVDGLHTCVRPLLCATPAGAAPLGVIFTSAQDEACLTAGFKLLQKSLGAESFFGKGRPDCLMTDDSAPECSALAAVWPESRQFSSVCHTLRQVWRWLLDNRHGIDKDQRQQLFSLTKSLVNAESPASFSAIWETYLADSMTQSSCDSFIRYMGELMERRAEWALAFRSCEMLRGHRNYNFAVASVCVLKHIVLNRSSKAENACQLVLLTEEWDDLVRQRLADVALGRRGKKATACEATAGLQGYDVVQTEGGDGSFKVKGEGDDTQVYDVDLKTGWCSCTKGQTGAVCQHQTACAEHTMTRLPKGYVGTKERLRRLAAVATGEEAAPTEDFFASLFEQHDSDGPSDAAAADAGTTDAASDPPSADEAMDAASEDDTVSVQPNPRQSLMARPSSAVVDALLSAFGDKVRALGDGMTEEGARQMTSRLKRMRTSAQLNSALSQFGDGVA